jgi:hypothetical protein
VTNVVVGGVSVEHASTEFSTVGKLILAGHMPRKQVAQIAQIMPVFIPQLFAFPGQQFAFPVGHLFPGVNKNSGASICTGRVENNHLLKASREENVWGHVGLMAFSLDFSQSFHGNRDLMLSTRRTSFSTVAK